MNGKWELLDKPFNYDVTIAFGIQDFKNPTTYQAQCKQYQQAKDNVLFLDVTLNSKSKDFVSIYLEGMPYGMEWDVDQNNFYGKTPNTIQDLVKYKPTLTEQGLIKSGL